MRSRTAAARGAVVGAALGIGATLFAQALTDSSTPSEFTRASIETVMAQALGRRVRDVSCEFLRRPFYTCAPRQDVRAGRLAAEDGEVSLLVNVDAGIT
jgi:hypothetical protein